MKAGTLHGWTPAPGRHIEWIVADEATARSNARIDAVGPSFLQRDHLAAAKAKRATGLPHRATVGTTTRIDEPLDADAMAAAITDYVRAHDEVRSFFDVTDAGEMIRHVAAPEDIAMVTTPADGGDSHAALTERLLVRIDAEATYDRVPGVIFGAVDAGSSFAFYTISDHSHTDGSASIQALSEIFTRYRAHQRGVAPDLPAAGSHLTDIVDEYRRASQVTPDDPAVDVWRTVLRDHGRTVPRCKLDLGLIGPDSAPSTEVIRTMLTAEQTEACERRARAAGGSLAGSMFAALARGEYEVTGESDFFTSTVLSTRDPQYPGTQGWLCNFAPVAVDGDEPDADALVVAASNALRANRDLVPVPAHAVLGLLAASGDFVPDATSPQMVSYLDFRRLADADSPEISAAGVMPGSGRTRNANLWVNRNDEGIHLLTHIPDNPTSIASVDAFHDRVIAFLVEYAAGAAPVAAAGVPVSAVAGDR